MVIGAGVARALLPCAWMRHGPLARTMGADAGVAGKIAAVGAASGVGTGIAVGVAGKVASMGSAAIAASRSRSPRSVILSFSRTPFCLCLVIVPDYCRAVYIWCGVEHIFRGVLKV